MPASTQAGRPRSERVLDPVPGAASFEPEVACDMDLRSLPVSLSLLAAALLGCASAPAEAPSRPYVFGWPFADTAALEPRGGTTRGAEVHLDLEPSEAWRELRADGLAKRDRDRAAIRALAGDYRTSFDFLETILYAPGAGPARPYRSWGTEQIVVIEEREDFVSLQHTLVMRVLDDEGNLLGPFVQKHWRQDWQYEPASRLVFRGHGRFGSEPVTPEARRGAWLQTVYQVDDSPRYSSLGRWSHDRQRSVWEGDTSWRPLPRREHSVRSDYQALAGNHRLTVLPTGWVHEQENEKLVLSPEGLATGSQAREIGLNRYERIRDFDFSAARDYWQATGGFWSGVRAAWDARIRSGADFRVSPTCDGEDGFVPPFRFAGELAEGKPASAAEIRAEAERVVACRVDTGDGSDAGGSGPGGY